VTEDLFLTGREHDASFVERVTPDPGALATCIGCGSCTASCPTGGLMAVSPRRLVRLVRLGLREEALRSRSFWLCTSCDACTASCPRSIRLLETMIGLKRFAVAQGSELPEDLELLRDTLRTARNISGEPNTERLMWSQNLPQQLPGLARSRGVDALYFVGCVSAFYPRAFSIPRAFGRILAHAGVSFTTLAGEEWCCGYPLLNAGLGSDVGAFVEHNVEQVRALGAPLLVTTCPSCYYAWKVLYPRYAALPPGLTVLHASQVLAELLERRRIRPGIVSQAVTYHDPCDLGRKGGEMDAPRRVLGALPGLELIEMASNREHALCCGGGGDVKISSHDATLEVARRRLRQAVDIDVDVIVSACQQCKRALIGAAQASRQPVRALDLTEVVWKSLHGKVDW
jgi:heterodisulfide reductase subunit D